MRKHHHRPYSFVSTGLSRCFLFISLLPLSRLILVLRYRQKIRPLEIGRKNGWIVLWSAWWFSFALPWPCFLSNSLSILLEPPFPLSLSYKPSIACFLAIFRCRVQNKIWWIRYKFMVSLGVRCVRISYITSLSHYNSFVFCVYQEAGERGKKQKREPIKKPVKEGKSKNASKRYFVFYQLTKYKPSRNWFAATKETERCSLHEYLDLCVHSIW